MFVHTFTNIVVLEAFLWFNRKNMFSIEKSISFLLLEFYQIFGIWIKKRQPHRVRKIFLRELLNILYFISFRRRAFNVNFVFYCSLNIHLCIATQCCQKVIHPPYRFIYSCRMIAAGNTRLKKFVCANFSTYFVDTWHLPFFMIFKIFKLLF